MPVPSRDEALRTLEEGHAAVLRLVDALEPDAAARPATIGGGDWSAQDLLGHLETWEEVALEALAEWRQGRTPRVETEIYGRPDGVDRFNASSVEAKRERTREAARRSADETHARLVAAIGGMSDEEWLTRAPYPAERRRRLAELLGAILGAPRRPFGHVFAHLPDLERYVQQTRSAG